MANTYNRKTIGKLMERVCPADATHDEVTKRLLANIDRLTEPKSEGAPASGH